MSIYTVYSAIHDIGEGEKFAEVESLITIGPGKNRDAMLATRGACSLAIAMGRKDVADELNAMAEWLFCELQKDAK